MTRKQVYLDPASDNAPRDEAKRRGISQAAAIPERLAPRQVAAPALPNPTAREWLPQRLRDVRETAAAGPGTGWRHERDVASTMCSWPSSLSVRYATPR